MREAAPCQGRIRLRRASRFDGFVREIAARASPDPSRALVDPSKYVACSPSRLHPRIALTRMGAMRG